ncbi:hypothetical protein FSARC_3203 [Fusarium sarcochroum]|uniref:Uncharacterized protein n=1 Tax=Fusarium sarcochroum TaxID=1208366 RepID=A0A8H4U4Z8_9HYPO|nr:hypothetical protein FSARC_3203 [Fusarium sarcochroum]
MAEKKSGPKPKRASGKKADVSIQNLTLDEAPNKRNSTMQNLQPSTQIQSTPHAHEGNTTQVTSSSGVMIDAFANALPASLPWNSQARGRAETSNSPEEPTEISRLDISEDDELSAHGDKDAKRGSAQRS